MHPSINAPVLKALLNGHSTIVLKLMDYPDFNSDTRSLSLIISSLVGQGDEDTIRSVLQRFPNAVRDQIDYPPLREAEKAGHESIVALLKSHGAL